MTAKELISAREQLGVTKSRMAGLLGYSGYRAYCRLENGERGIMPQTSILVRALLAISDTKYSEEFLQKRFKSPD